MTTVTIKPTGVASFPQGGGHFWVFLQYAHALRKLGCNVYWLERFESLGSPDADGRALRRFREHMEAFGLSDRVVLYRRPTGSSGARNDDICEMGFAVRSLREVAMETDLLLNFDYSIERRLLERFRRTALVDIDPGLLQFWVSVGQLHLEPHDVYLTTGETIGTSGTRVPDLAKNWVRFRPPVCCDLWPFVHTPRATTLTTVSGWWGGNGKGEWITAEGVFFENNKRVTFLEVKGLPGRTEQPLELALALGDGDEAIDRREQIAPEWNSPTVPPVMATDYVSDAADRRLMEQHGWRIRHASEVAGTPWDYRRYIQGSRGEFSCAKPSCRYFANAWISDRTLCYLASGKPAIVQDTGPSEVLPAGEGLFRFGDEDGALAAIDEMNANYRYHCEAARALAETHFDGPDVLADVLNESLAGVV